MVSSDVQDSLFLSFLFSLHKALAGEASSRVITPHQPTGGAQDLLVSCGATLAVYHLCASALGRESYTNVCVVTKMSEGWQQWVKRLLPDLIT